MLEELSPRQQAMLDYIRKFIGEHGYPPSVRETGQAVGLTSSDSAHRQLRQLERKGYIHRDPARPRALEVLYPRPDRIELKDVPLIGRIAAGMPILAAENVEEVFRLPADLAPGERVFMLTVQGDSMCEAGILSGDYVIIRSQETAANGDIVAALIGEEATVKRFFREKGHIRLQPANPAYQPIITDQVLILGKVVGVWRRYA